MIDEFKKSINNILYERVTSPFYGTFIISWIIWNWNIVYLTLFVSEKSLKVSKLVYINSNLIDYCKMIWYPLASSALLILVLPFVANGAFYVNLKFSAWKKNQKQIIEGDELLSKNESIALRKEILEQENKFLLLLNSKDKEIEILKEIAGTSKVNNNTSVEDDQELINLVEKIKVIPNFKQFYKNLLFYIQGGHRIEISENLPSDFISLFEANSLIQKNGNFYDFTSKGMKFQQMILE
jgi:hypothetical protein